MSMPETLPAGRTVFQAANRSKTPRGLEVKGGDVDQKLAVHIKPGGTQTLALDLEPGKYQVLSNGLESSLTVK